ncbi:NEDD8-activating enzyme E1 regulatory subunit [Aphelenchoides besseyi]|nr:NEDD8-activating enzyme E1 regulatory subunit [Aphelenchoides besseyi]KAI6199355.1 NEDD8-activating enzyme E1 regulatory subunit [Aphelenchoides besseyi]
MTVDVTDRYDRQVRLWGDHGQHSISQAKIAVIGSSALSTEILKSLILAGIGSYEIFDHRIIQESDLGNNFFVTKDDLGKLRGKIVCENLNEMNPSVKGAFQNLEFTLDSSFEVFAQYSLVVGVHLSTELAIKISDFLFEKNIPFVWTTIVGFVGYVRVVYKEHEVLNDHKEMPPHDFRIQRPFSALLEFVKGFDLDAMNHEQHSHVPYLVLYLKALEKWRARINDSEALPSNYKLRKDFTATLMEMQMLNEKGIYNQDNFAEAKQHLIRSFSGFEINSNLKKLFDDPRTDQQLDKTTSSFWIYVSAIKSFYQANGYLPISGRLPDMTSDTNTYTSLLEVYRKQAAMEAEEVFHLALRVRSSPKCRKKEITLEETQKFCKYASRLNAFSGTRLSSEFANSLSSVFAQLLREVEEKSAVTPENGSPDGTVIPHNPSVHPLVWLIVLKAVENFHSGKNRYPGTNGVPCALDTMDLIDRIKTFAAETNDSDIINRFHELIPVRAIEEICRYGHAELNTTASIMGGIISQEIIKLCTQQYIPIDNTLIFDGNNQNSATIRL